MIQRLTRPVLALAAVLPALGLLSPTPAAAAGDPWAAHAEAVAYQRAHGYLPAGDPTRYEQFKAAAASAARAAAPAAAVPAALHPFSPTALASWQGVSESDVVPSDSSGAIGPSRYVETINLQLAIYGRSGGMITSAGLDTMTNVNAINLSDPQVIWDPATSRFYYTVLDLGDDTIRWGFSKGPDPAVLPADFCNYDADFHYGSILPDYPKLGDTQHALLIGTNDFAGKLYVGSDVDFITKPAQTGLISTCPPQTFTLGQEQGLLDSNGKKAWTPEPAVQTDPATGGWVVAVPNPFVGQANKLLLYKVAENANGIPTIAQKGTDVPTKPYNMPPSAPQRPASGTASLDTLDTRLTNAVSGNDPAHGGATAVWTSHTIAGGAGSEVRWYEINTQQSNLFQSGDAIDGTLWAFNSAIAPDRAVNGSSTAFGSDMVLGFTVSSATGAPADEMVSKVAGAQQSPFVLVHQSPGVDEGAECYDSNGQPVTPCRWGDFGGASADPVGTEGTGHVWLSNQFSTGGGPNPFAAEWGTWNWEAAP